MTRRSPAATKESESKSPLRADVTQHWDSPSWRLGVAAGLLSALLFTLAWPPFGAWPLVFIAIAPLIAWARTARRARTAFLVVFATQMPSWIVLEWWIFELTPPGFFVLAAMMSVYPALFAVAVARVARSSRFGSWPNAVVVPILWCSFEFARTTLVLGGYPWFPLGLPVIGGWESSGLLAQSAGVFGLGGLSFSVALVNGALVDLLIRRRRGWRTMAGPALAATAVVAASAAYGALVLATRSVREGPRVLVVQTNLSVSNKNRWEPAAQARDTGETIRASYDAFRAAERLGSTPDVIVWPETMVPGMGLEKQAIDLTVREGLYPGSVYLDALLDLVQATNGTPLLVGSPSYIGLRTEGTKWRWDKQFNSAYLVTGSMPFHRYDKLELTPFGERMPVISNFDWLEEKLLAVGAPGMTFDLDAGRDPVRFLLSSRANASANSGNTFRVATPICFEDTVPWVGRRLVYEGGAKAVDVLINLSNDGWFGPGKPSILERIAEAIAGKGSGLVAFARDWETFASQGGREQHVLHARLRSIELGLPMVRSANTGLSVVIDDRGTVIDWIGREEGGAAPGKGTIPGTMVATVPLVDRSTLYGRIGDAWSYLLLVAGILLVAIARRQQAATESAT